MRCDTGADDGSRWPRGLGTSGKRASKIAILLPRCCCTYTMGVHRELQCCFRRFGSDTTPRRSNAHGSRHRARLNGSQHFHNNFIRVYHLSMTMWSNCGRGRRRRPGGGGTDLLLSPYHTVTPLYCSAVTFIPVCSSWNAIILFKHTTHLDIVCPSSCFILFCFGFSFQFKHCLSRTRFDAVLSVTYRIILYYVIAVSRPNRVFSAAQKVYDGYLHGKYNSHRLERRMILHLFDNIIMHSWNVFAYHT